MRSLGLGRGFEWEGREVVTEITEPGLDGWTGNEIYREIGARSDQALQGT
jgi:hypothetical protein